MATFQYSLAEAHTLDRSPLEKLRRRELYRMAVDSGILVDDKPMPPKDALITLLASGQPMHQPEPTKDMTDMSKYEGMKNPELWTVCKEMDIPWVKTDKREVLLHRIYEKLNGVHAA